MSKNTEEIGTVASAINFAPATAQSQAASKTAFAPRLSNCDCCGRPLETRPLGRPRTTCSDTCRRTLDRVMRKVRRREMWVRAWEDMARRGEISISEMRRECRGLEADVREILRALRPLTSDDTGRAYSEVR